MYGEGPPYDSLEGKSSYLSCCSRLFSSFMLPLDFLVHGNYLLIFVDNPHSHNMSRISTFED